jgi:hypothetical protein
MAYCGKTQAPGSSTSSTAMPQCRRYVGRGSAQTRLRRRPHFTAKKKVMAQLSPKGASMLAGLFYPKCRQLLEAKCFWAGVELNLIDHACTSTMDAARHGWSVYAAAGVTARRGPKLTERLPRAGPIVRIPVRGAHPAVELPARKRRKFRVVACHGVHAAYRGGRGGKSSGSSPAATRRARVRKVPFVIAFTQLASAGRPFALRK